MTRTLFCLALCAWAGLNPGTAHAADRWWDGGAADIVGDGDGVGTGGAGIWDTTITNWDQGSALPHVAWVNANNDTANFAGTTGTITVGANVSAGKLTFDSANFTINTTNGQTLTLAGPAPTIVVGTNAAGNGVTGTILLPVQGTGGLLVNSLQTNSTLINSTLVFGTNNTYSGGTVIRNGVLSPRGRNAAGIGSVTLGDGSTMTGSRIGFQLGVVTPAGAAGAYTNTQQIIVSSATTPANVQIDAGFASGVNARTMLNDLVLQRDVNIISQNNLLYSLRNVSGNGNLTLIGTSAGLMGRIQFFQTVDVNTFHGNITITQGSGTGSGMQIGETAAAEPIYTTPGARDFIRDDCIITNNGGFAGGNGVLVAVGSEVIGALSGVIPTAAVTCNLSTNLDGSGALVATLVVGGGNCSGDYSGIYRDNLTTLNPLALTKIGTGTQVFNSSASWTATGPAIVSNGVLQVDCPVAAPVDVHGGTLGGIGTIAGVVTVHPGGTVAPGASIGTLTLGTSPVLNGTVRMEVDRSGLLADKIDAGGSAITYNGTLVITNTGAALQVGDTFDLFDTAGGFGGAFNIATHSPGQYVTWNPANLTVDGTITVATVATVLPPVTAVRNGGNLDLSWPPGAFGAQLQVQTNSLAVGISNNWSPVAGSTSVTNLSVPVNPANPSVFLRLVSPPQ